jgi:hypothetical protein
MKEKKCIRNKGSKGMVKTPGGGQTGRQEVYMKGGTLSSGMTENKRWGS